MALTKGNIFCWDNLCRRNCWHGESLHLERPQSWDLHAERDQLAYLQFWRQATTHGKGHQTDELDGWNNGQVRRCASDCCGVCTHTFHLGLPRQPWIAHPQGIGCQDSRVLQGFWLSGFPSQHPPCISQAIQAWNHDLRPGRALINIASWDCQCCFYFVQTKDPVHLKRCQQSSPCNQKLPAFVPFHDV